MKGDTIVDFPVFNFAFAMNGLLIVVEHCYWVTLANQLSVTFTDLPSSWVTLAKQVSVTFADLQVCMSNFAKMRKPC